MKRLTMIFVAASILWTGCSKDSGADADGSNFPLKLTAVMSPFTTDDMPEELQVGWPGDAVLGVFEFDVRSSLFTNSNREFRISQETGAGEGLFSGTAQTGDGWSDGEKIFYAYYPYDRMQTSVTAVAFSVPATQTQTESDPMAHLMQASFLTCTQNLSPGHDTQAQIGLGAATAVMQFNIKNEIDDEFSIEKLVVRTNGGTIYKSGVYNFRQGTYTFTDTDKTSDVTLFTEEPVTLAAGDEMVYRLSLLSFSVPAGGEVVLDVYTDLDMVSFSSVAPSGGMNFEAGKLYITEIPMNPDAFNKGGTISLPESQNSFIVAPPANDKETYLSLPLSRVNEFWESVDPSKMINETTKWVADIIWQDFDLTGEGEALTITPGKGMGTGPIARIGLTLKSYPDDQWGNAVVGVRKSDDNGNPVGNWLWSWHIWVTDFTEDDAVTYAGSNHMAMDRYLGAKNNIPGDAGALGLLYQCTRKDPFPGAAATTPGTTVRAATTLDSWPVEGPENGGNFIFAVEHPTTFIKAVIYSSPVRASNVGDWLISPMSNQAMYWLRDKKGIQDPCPKGWKVADVLSSGAASTWSDFVYGTTFVYNAANNGYYYNATDWWPLPGSLNPVNGELEYVGERMHVATMGGASYTFATGIPEFQTETGGNTTNYVLRHMYFTTTEGTNNSREKQRASGFSVRCIRFTADDN